MTNNFFFLFYYADITGITFFIKFMRTSSLSNHPSQTKCTFPTRKQYSLYPLLPSNIALLYLPIPPKQNTPSGPGRQWSPSPTPTSQYSPPFTHPSLLNKMFSLDLEDNGLLHPPLPLNIAFPLPTHPSQTKRTLWT